MITWLQSKINLLDKDQREAYEVLATAVIISLIIIGLHIIYELYLWIGEGFGY